jgi:hypothetical protein
MRPALIKSSKLLSAVTPTAGAAGTSVINGTIIDCAGFNGCLIAVHMGTIVSGAVTSIKAQSGNDSGLSDAADIAGTSQSIADTDDDKVFYIDVARGQKRYLKVVISRATQNATLSAVYVLYNARAIPATQDAAVAGVSVVGP